MSLKAVSWALVIAMALGGVLLLNYWASFQPLSTLAYSGIVLALAGLANVVVPFRFLGVRRRVAGLLILVSGVGLAYAALLWPAPMIRVAQPRSVLDEIVPEYQFSEKHSVRVHARPEQAVQAIRQSTLGDLKSLVTLMKIRGAVYRQPFQGFGEWQDKPFVDSFLASGYLIGGNEREIAIFGVVDVRAKRRPEVHSLPELAAYRKPGGVVTAFDFIVEDAGDGWSNIFAETRMMATDDATCRGAGRYWRLIVPGSGLLRLQWLEGIKGRAERLAGSRS